MKGFGIGDTSEKMCSLSLNDAPSIQMSGYSITRPTAISRACLKVLRPALRLVPTVIATVLWSNFVSIVIVHPVLREPEVDGRHECDDHEQDPGHGARVAHLESGETTLVEVQRVEERRVDRAAGASRDDEGRREGLERSDHLQNEVEQDDRAQHRQSDMPERAPSTDAVDGSGLVEVLRDLAESREEDDHRRAEGPDVQDHEGAEGCLGVADPAHSLDA